jgi:hypothetical protein
MKINLLHCDAHKPDRRAIAKCIEEISSNIDEHSARELTSFLLEGDAVEIEVSGGRSSSGVRALRKLGIEYELIE